MGYEPGMLEIENFLLNNAFASNVFAIGALRSEIVPHS
jgi:hypothetical protein